jgi:hypothetical protein
MQQHDDLDDPITAAIAWGEAEIERIESEHAEKMAERNKREAKLDAARRRAEISLARLEGVLDAPKQEIAPLPGEWQSAIRRLT